MVFNTNINKGKLNLIELEEDLLVNELLEI